MLINKCRATERLLELGIQTAKDINHHLNEYSLLTDERTQTQ